MAYFYVDNTNALDDTHTGLRIPAGDHDSTSYNVIDSTADTTHFVDSALTGADDYLNGSYFYNVTRSAGSVISDFVASSDTVTLASAVAGMAADDEYYILDSFKTIAQFTTAGASRSSGDKCYVRANQTHTITAIVEFDEDGSTDYIYLIGCNATQGIDPYHDSSDTRPIIDANNGAYYLNIAGDYYWYLKNLDIKYTNVAAYGCVHILQSTGTVVDNCILRDQANSGGYNLYIGQCSHILIKDCTIHNSEGMNIITSSYSQYIILDNCDVYSGAKGSTYGLYTSTTGIYCVNCDFGGNSLPHVSSDLYAGTTCFIYTKNCTCASTTKYTVNTTGYAYNIFYCEDYLGVYGDHAIISNLGTTLRKTDVVRTGGATSSAQMIPTNLVNWMRPLLMAQSEVNKPDFVVWLPAGAATVTIYIRGLNWASFPTATQLWVEAEYLSDDSPITYTRVVSDEVLSDNTTWVGFQCAVSPHAASFVSVWVKLGLYEDATTGIYVDVKPVIT